MKQQISALDAGGVFRADVPDLTWRDGIKLNLQVRLPSPLRALVCVHPDIAPSRKTLAERGRQHTRRVGFCFRPLNELNLSNRSEDNRFDCSRCGDRSRTRRRASCFIEQGRSSLRAWGLKLAKGIWHAKGKGRHRHANRHRSSLVWIDAPTARVLHPIVGEFRNVSLKTNRNQRAD